ncbi:MAG TPA: 23S rRNA (guanosine(2251)-2'-O)-methyltransferase RlmB [Thermomicrobiales bacterium]|nr:23S rRNA (guanosine(2251)-2'-O)-methyltransferase RlmB [Thermomicrobiales bacterium]
MNRTGGGRRDGRIQRNEDEGGPRGRGPRPPRPAKPAKPQLHLKGELLYGRNAVRESLRADRRTPTTLYVAEGVREDDRIREIIDLSQEQGALLDRVPRQLLDDVTRGGNHQGVALDTGEFPYADLEDVLEAEGTVVVMDHLSDPQNFGTLMRAADASGVAGIILPQDRSVSVTPAVVNASAGAIEHLTVALTPNLARALDKLEESGRWIIGMDEDEEANSLFDADIPTPVALVLGAEGSGLSPIVRKRCQMVISIPMRGHVDSLNAATAGSIVLYDLLRRQEKPA